MSKEFDDIFRRDVAPLLSDPNRLPDALVALEDMMPKLKTDEARAEVYRWLGTVHTSLAVGSLQQENVDEAKAGFALVEEYFAKSIEADPKSFASRLSLARYYLTFGNEFSSALELLESRENADQVNLDVPLEAAMEHQRLALRGVALAFLDRSGESQEAFDQAFHERFAGKVPPQNIDVSSLRYLSGRGVRFAPDSAAAIMDRLRMLGYRDEEKLAIIQERLVQA